MCDEIEPMVWLTSRVRAEFPSRRVVPPAAFMTRAKVLLDLFEIPVCATDDPLALEYPVELY